MKHSSVKGMNDILPGQTESWQRLETLARKSLESYGFREIRTPVLEDTDVFIRGVGETTDIVTKEMFTFADRKERSLTLRPEGTAPVVRSYVEHNLSEKSADTKLYYIGPMFRSERPQKGRSRQFHQIGTEVIGTDSPYADVEVISQLDAMLKTFGLRQFVIKINSLGCPEDKQAYTEKLRDYLKDKSNLLCKDCKERVSKNVLRVLDCKNDACKAALRGAPDVLETHCQPCKDHFRVVTECLSSLGVSFQLAKHLVRGLDYYTRTVFEITHSALGGQDALAAGGRYDNLVRQFGGPAVGAVGYALGMERVLIALKDAASPDRKPVVAIATHGDAAKFEGLKLAENIRKHLDAVVLTDVRGTSFKAQLRGFDKAGAGLVVIIGEDELKKGAYLIKDMSLKEQKEIDAGGIVEEVKKKLGSIKDSN